MRAGDAQAAAIWRPWLLQLSSGDGLTILVKRQCQKALVLNLWPKMARACTQSSRLLRRCVVRPPTIQAQARPTEPPQQARAREAGVWRGRITWLASMPTPVSSKRSDEPERQRSAPSLAVQPRLSICWRIRRLMSCLIIERGGQDWLCKHACRISCVFLIKMDYHKHAFT